jgi:hypothetical protein
MDPDTLGLHRARVFVGHRCALGETLVVPIWTVWKEYQAFGARNGFQARAKDLRRLFDEAPWATVVERPQARGRLKTIVVGVGLRPVAPGAMKLA